MFTQIEDGLSGAVWEKGGPALSGFPDGRASAVIPEEVRQEAIDFAIETWPQEACGLFLYEDGKVWLRRCSNISPEPQNAFEIDDLILAEALDTKLLLGIFHSHTEGQLEPSYADMESQIALDIPFYVCTLAAHEGTFMDFWAFGDQLPTLPLLHRDFRSGIADCYATFRDYHWLVHGTRMPNAPRDPEWWESPQAENPFESMFLTNHFEEVPTAELQIGDGLLFALRGGYLMHCGVYIGEGLFLHHLHGKISQREPFVQWQRFLKKVVRYRGNT